MTEIDVVVGEDGFLNIQASGHTDTDICAAISASLQSTVRFLQELEKQFPDKLKVTIIGRENV